MICYYTNVAETSNSSIRIVIALGNPGARYAHTYHNAGIVVLNGLKRILQPSAPRTHFLRSSVFMNESGSFVSRELARRKMTPGELLVVHDDSDLPLGSYKLSFGRGSAGHRGVASIIAALKTKSFWRLRIGIRPAAAPGSAATVRKKAGSFVLAPIRAPGREAIARAAAEAAAVVREKLV